MVEETRTQVIATMFKALSVSYDAEKLTVWANLFRDTDIVVLGDACKHLMNEHDKMRVMPKHLRDAVKASGHARYARQARGIESMCESCGAVYRTDGECANHLRYCLESPSDYAGAERRWREMGARAHAKGHPLAAALFGPKEEA